VILRFAPEELEEAARLGLRDERRIQEAELGYSGRGFVHVEEDDQVRGVARVHLMMGHDRAGMRHEDVSKRIIRLQISRAA
jgi:hypothetical protein